MTREEIEQWPAMRARTARFILWSVLLKGPLFGIALSVVLIGAAAILNQQLAGDTLDFGWFQIPGKVGAQVFPVHLHFCNFIPWAVIVGSLFFLLVGAGAWVTCETEFRRHLRSAKKGSKT